MLPGGCISGVLIIMFYIQEMIYMYFIDNGNLGRKRRVSANLTSYARTDKQLPVVDVFFMKQICIENLDCIAFFLCLFRNARMVHIVV